MSNHETISNYATAVYSSSDLKEYCGNPETSVAVYSAPDQKKRVECSKDFKEQKENCLNGSWPSVYVSGSCFDFCNSQGLLRSLNSSLEKIKVLFSNREYLWADFGCYQGDDIEQPKYVVIRLKVSSDRATQKSEYKKWREWFIDNIYDQHRIMIVLDIVRI